MTEKELALYRKVWLKAFETSEVELKFASLKDAYRIRFGLYETRKKVKTGELIDPKLLEAVSTCSIHLDKAGMALKIGTRFYSEAFGVLADAVGYDPLEDVRKLQPGKVDSEEIASLKAVSDSLQKTLSKLNQDDGQESEAKPFDYAAIRAAYSRSDKGEE